MTTTRQRVDPRASEDVISLDDAALRAGYNRETLRKMMWGADPPPLFKFRGRWYADVVELDAWLEHRDGAST